MYFFKKIIDDVDNIHRIAVLTSNILISHELINRILSFTSRKI